ncbi:MAG: hypothetical protein ACTHJ0_05165 [Flavipsychrobacter sp.]
MAIRYSVDVSGREFIIEKYSDESGNVKYYVKSFNGVKSENFFMERNLADNAWHITSDYLVSKGIQNIERELSRAIAHFRATLEN